MGLDCAKELPTDAGTVETAAIANAKASVILINMVILLVLKPDVLPRTRSRNAAFISALAFEWGSLGTSLRVRCEVGRSHQCQWPLQPNELSDSEGDVPHLRHELGESGRRRALLPMPSAWCRGPIVTFHETPLRQIGSSQ